MLEGCWGLYPWFAENGDDWVHPEDRHRFQATHPYGHLFQIERTEGPYLVLRYHGGSVRVLPDLFHPKPAPPFGYGDTVQTRPPCTPRLCKVVGIQWHHQRNEPFFLLTEQGRALSRRYWGAELDPALDRGSSPT